MPTHDFGWRYEPIGNEAFLLTPAGQRVGRMAGAFARGIAAALNTDEGMAAFMAARVEGREDYRCR